MAYEKQNWQSNELLTSEKLNHMENGIATVNTKLDKNFSDSNYSSAVTPFTGNEKIPLQQSGNNVYTDFNTLSTYFGGSGSSQTALVNYKTTTANFSSLPQTITDANITNQMVIIEAVLSNPTAQVADISVETSNGSYIIGPAGAINDTTNFTLTFGAAPASAPSILTNLSSTTSANILSESPRPGVTGILPRAFGGTGVEATDAADLRSKLGITPANIGAVAKTGDVMNGSLAFNSTGYNGLGVQFSYPDSNNGLSNAYSIYAAADGSFLWFANYEPGIEWKYFMRFDKASGIVALAQPLGIASGGTGATQGTIDITDYCVFPNANKFDFHEPYGGRLYYNPYLNCVFGTIVTTTGTIVDNQEVLVYLRKDASGTVLSANRQAVCGVCVHDYTSIASGMPRIAGDAIFSSHKADVSITSPVYTIMAFLG